MSSFIGCKISLISKAGIRYEGILYTIDPRESTVALSKVKSFGTEDRKVERAIPPRDEIYEYIIFRGSDIQDLNVCEPNKESSLLSEDSAIVRAETSVININRNLPPGVLTTGPMHHHIDSAWSSNNHRSSFTDKSVNSNLKTGGGSAINNAKTKETFEQQNSAISQPIGSNRYHPQSSGSATNVTGSSSAAANHNSNDITATTNNAKKQYQVYLKNHKQDNRGSLEAITGGDDSGKYEYRGKSKQQQQQQHQHQQSQVENKSHKYTTDRYGPSYHDYEYNNYQHDNTSGGAVTNNGGGYHKYQGNSYHDGSSRDYYHVKDFTRYRRNDYRRDFYYGGPDSSKLRGFESSDGTRDYYSQYYDYKTRNGPDKYAYDNTTAAKNKKKPNRESEASKKNEGFKEDYDFETANAIIAKELANLNISQEKKDFKDDECIKDDCDMSDSSETGYYDKTKSFFDNISSEMLDRANGKNVRPMNRKEERKINVETFGVAESSRNLGRNSSKWNRGNRYYSKTSRSSNYPGAPPSYRGNSNDTYKKDVVPYRTSKGTAGYGSGRRPVIVDGPGRGDDY